MDQLIEKQTAVDIYMDTECDLTNVTEVTVKIMRPDGTIIDNLPATIHSDKRTVIHKFRLTDEYGVGVYKIWPYLIFEDGRKAPCKSKKIEFLEEGS